MAHAHIRVRVNMRRRVISEVKEGWIAIGDGRGQKGRRAHQRMEMHRLSTRTLGSSRARAPTYGDNPRPQ